MWTVKGTGGRQEVAGWAHSLSSFVNKAVSEGFTENFKVSSRGLYAITHGRYFRPEQIRVIKICHFEAHAPAVSSDMFILETFDGIKGILVDSGTLAIAFIKDVQSYQERVDRFNRHQC